MIVDPPMCCSCEYYKKEMSYYSCRKYERIPKEIINWEKDCKYYKEDN